MRKAQLDLKPGKNERLKVDQLNKSKKVAMYNLGIQIPDTSIIQTN